MKKLFAAFLMAFFLFANAQESKETANRFFYELTFKPKKDSAKLDKVMTILDCKSPQRLDHFIPFIFIKLRNL